MAALATELHREAIAAYGRGGRAEAIALIRRAIADALDPDLVNDLAVMLADAGERAEAVELLRGLLRLAPGFEPARENLALALPPGAGAKEARAAFLQLVSEAAATRLADNLDHLFHPTGHPLPDPALAGERLAEQLAVLERSSVFWQRLGDETSRDLYLRLLAYRALGPAHVRLQLRPLEYRQSVVGLTAGMLRRAGVQGAPGAPFEWQLHLYDLTQAGLPIQVIGSPLPLASTYVFSQYAYRDATVDARPRPGDVALDVGGCWGETALWLAHAVGTSGTVHTFEPSPGNREVLRANLDLNRVLATRIRVHEAPLAAAAGESVAMDAGMGPGASLREAPREGKRTCILRTETIDALVEGGELERVDFLKVDVEGADLAVLEGAARTIREQRPRLALAAYHRPDDLVRIPDFVESLGVDYRWYLQCSTMTDVDTVAFAVPV